MNKKTKTKKVRKIKKWGIIRDDMLLECYPMCVGRFMQRIYNTEETARNVARKLPEDWNIQIVPVEIHYSL